MTEICRPRRGRRAAALAVLLTIALARGAEAAPSAGDRLRLTWSAAEGCPSEQELLAEVDKLLGDRAPRAASKEPVAVKATVSREAGGSFVVRLETPGEGSTQARELRGATCNAVADAAALILALMVDPDAAMAPEESAPSEPKTPGINSAKAGEESSSNTEPIPPPRSASAPAAPSAPPPTRAAARAQKPKPPSLPAPSPAPSIDLRLNAWAGADIGSLPGLAPGLGALGSIALGAPRVSLGIAFWPDKAGTLDALPSAGSDVGLLAGDLGICAALLRNMPVEIAPCAAAEIGQIFAEGFGVSDPRRGAAVWIALKGGGALALRPFPKPFNNLGLTARIEAVIPLVRPRFVIEGIGPVHSPAYVAGRASLGIEISL